MKNFLSIVLIIFTACSSSAQSVWHVRSSAMGAGTGLNWNDAFSNLHSALTVAQAGEQVWVAGGTYLPDAGTNRDHPFVLSSGVQLLGGFNGTETALTQRNIGANPTLLSGNIGSPTGSWPTFRYCDFIKNTALLYHGGAIFMTGGNLHDQGIEFNHCRFIDNKAAKQAGGICVTKSVGAGSLDFFACVAEGNNGSVLAGFMSYLSAGIAVRSITLDSCRLLKNYSELGAPGLNLTSFVDVRTVFVLKNSEITQHNSSEVSTYGVINLSSASDYAVDSVWILNNNFHDNQGYSVCALGSSLYAAFTGNTITNNNFGAYIYAPYCYIENNIAENNLSSAISSGGYLSVLCNNLFAQNGNSQLSYFQLFYNATNPPMGIQIKNYVFNNTFIDNLYQDNHNPNSTPATGLNICYNNIFQGNTNTFDGQLGIPLQTDLDSNYFAYNLLDRDCNTLGARSICGPGNLLTSDPQFVDAAAKDYRLSPCSPGVDAGWNALPDTFHILSDLNGLPRIINGFVDIGAYENPAFALAEAPVIKAACSGLANGSVSFAVSNGCPPYQLTWANGSENSLIINNLMAGSYQISLTDSQNKATVVSIVIPASNMVVTPTIQKASSATTPDGAISLAVSAGLAPYQYLWSDGNTSAQRSGLLPGFYQLTITVYPCSYRQIAGHTSLTGLSFTARKEYTIGITPSSP